MSKKIIKNSNIILRVDDEFNKLIGMKASLFGIKKSAFIRESCLSNWNISNQQSFKNLLNIYKSFNENERILVIDILFQFYRRYGFPHSFLTDDEKVNRMSRLKNTSVKIANNDEISINCVGLDLANSFHHQMEYAKSRSDKYFSPIEAYQDDDKFKDCIKRWLDLGKSPTPSGIRKILRTRNGVSCVTNFKPSVAKYLYQQYCPDNGIVLDPCAGFSGRLLGAIAAQKNIHYYGIDVEPLTAEGNMKCAAFFSGKEKFRFSFSLDCAESAMLNYRNDYFDIVFTSPPYFDLETYSEYEMQSSNCYGDYDSWLKNFLYKIIDESCRILKKQGKFIINVKNLAQYKISDDLIKYCLSRDLKLVKTYKMLLANREFRRKDSTVHYEPIFVFEK